MLFGLLFALLFCVLNLLCGLCLVCIGYAFKLCCGVWLGLVDVGWCFVLMLRCLWAEFAGGYLVGVVVLYGWFDWFWLVGRLVGWFWVFWCVVVGGCLVCDFVGLFVLCLAVC